MGLRTSGAPIVRPSLSWNLPRQRFSSLEIIRLKEFLEAYETIKSKMNGGSVTDAALSNGIRTPRNEAEANRTTDVDRLTAGRYEEDRDSLLTALAAL